MRVVQNLTKGYLGMACSRDVARRNLQSNKGKFLLPLTFCFVDFASCSNTSDILLEHLSHVASDMDSANARVTELEAQVANLEKELAAAKKKKTAAMAKAEDALAKEQAALKQEEDLTPRVQAIVNSLAGG